jgi:GYF domain 2
MDRSWFYASQGQQQGPFPEVQLRSLIARGAVTPDTLVWTDGMAGWQRAGDIPGLASGPGSRPPAVPQPGGPMAGAGGQYSSAGSHDGGGPLSIDFGILEFTWRSLVFAIGMIFIIPAPWAIVWYLRWIVPCVHVPGRPNLSFEGQAMTLVPWYFGAIALVIVAALTGIHWINNLMLLVQIALYWLFFKWFFVNLASNGQPLGLSFVGSPWAFLGWSVLAAISFITIIGWAWVYVASMRWFCRNIEGSRREAIFNGTGLEFLWRSIVTAIACGFIIPIPWMYRWLMQWLASQTVLVERNTHESV